MEIISEKMPTELIRRKKGKIEVIPKSKYDHLNRLYNEVIQIGEELLDMIDERDAYIDHLEDENARLRIKAEVRYEKAAQQFPSDTTRRKKFDGATLSYNARTRSLGIGLRFRDAE